MATDHLTAMSGRRPFLTALDEAVRKRGGMSCGIVPRGGTPVLYMINTESPTKFTEIGADFIGGAWMYTWAATGRTLGAANAPTIAADTIARAIGAHHGLRPCWGANSPTSHGCSSYSGRCAYSSDYI
ncbi:Uncharacterised protein [Mycobacterium tuberculosis]|nr:Uncharacterised protein [Mycobacterium tuberculosis]